MCVCLWGGGGGGGGGLLITDNEVLSVNLLSIRNGMVSWRDVQNLTRGSAMLSSN